MPPEMITDAIDTIRNSMDSPMIAPLLKLIPELQTMFSQIDQYLNNIELPMNPSLVRTIAKIQDDTFLNSDFDDSYTLHSTESETISISDFLTDDSLQYEDFGSDCECISEEFRITYTNYTPKISTDPLPVPYISDNNFSIYCSK